MKASELIAELQKAVVEHGDLDILARYPADGYSWNGLIVRYAPASSMEKAEGIEDAINISVFDCFEEAQEMKASKLIAELQKAVAEHGDLGILVHDSSDGCSWSGLTVWPDPASPAEEEEGVKGTIDLTFG